MSEELERAIVGTQQEIAKLDRVLKANWLNDQHRELVSQQKAKLVCKLTAIRNLSKISISQECRNCHCTNERGCMTEHGPCYWVAPNLCSACVPVCCEGVC